MEDNYIDNGELTFRKIGQKLKAAWLRAVVYIIIAVLISSILMGIISTVNMKTTFKAKVIFSNNNLNEEMTPWDTNLNITNSVKSTAVVDKSLEDIGITGDDKTAKIPLVISNLVVNPQFVQDKTEDEKVEQIDNFIFEISLENYKNLGLSKDKTQELLNAICNNFVLQYRDQFSYDNVNLAFDSVLNAFNYVYASEMLEIEINKAIDYANNMSLVDPSFVEKDSKLTFTLIASEFNGLKNQLKSIHTYLAQTGTMKDDKSITSESKYIDQQLVLLAANQDVLKEQVRVLTEKSEELSQAMKPTINPGSAAGSIIVNQDQKEYIALVNQLLKKQEEFDLIGKQIKLLNQLKLGYAPDGVFALASDEEKLAMQTKMNVMIKSIVDDSDRLAKSLNNGIKQFNESKNLSECVKVNQVATVNNVRTIGTMMFVGIDVIVVIVAFIIAMVVTNKKGKINLKKKQVLDSANAKDKEDSLNDENNK